MSVNSGLQKSSVNEDVMQMRMDNRPAWALQPPEKRSNFDVTGNLQAIHVNSSVSMRSIGNTSPQYMNRQMQIQTQLDRNYDNSQLVAP